MDSTFKPPALAALERFAGEVRLNPPLPGRPALIARCRFPASDLTGDRHCD